MMTTLNAMLLLKFIFTLSLVFPLFIASYFFRLVHTKKLIQVRNH